MLILTRRPDQGIVIDENITVTILAVDGDRVKVGIDAPVEVPILRSELHSAVGAENRAALAPARHALKRVLRSANAPRRMTG